MGSRSAKASGTRARFFRFPHQISAPFFLCSKPGACHLCAIQRPAAFGGPSYSQPVYVLLSNASFAGMVLLRFLEPEYLYTASPFPEALFLSSLAALLP